MTKDRKRERGIPKGVGKEVGERSLWQMTRGKGGMWKGHEK